MDKKSEKFPPDRVWLPLGVVSLAAVSPELKNVEGAWYNREVLPPTTGESEGPPEPPLEDLALQAAIFLDLISDEFALWSRNDAKHIAYAIRARLRHASPAADEEIKGTTPRPWRANTFAIYGANGESAAHTGGCGRTSSEQIANAELIAAAVNAYAPATNERKPESVNEEQNPAIPSGKVAKDSLLRYAVSLHVADLKRTVNVIRDSEHALAFKRTADEIEVAISELEHALTYPIPGSESIPTTDLGAVRYQPVDLATDAAVGKLVSALSNAVRCLERPDRSQLSVRKSIEKGNDALLAYDSTTGGKR